MTLNPRVRAQRKIVREDPATGHAGGPNAGREIKVLYKSKTIGRPQVKSIVMWDPQNGQPAISMEVDCFPLSEADITEAGTIHDGRWAGILMICPKCGPNAPLVGPYSAQGQIYLNADVGERSAKNKVTPWFDEMNRLNILETVRCGWLCGWTVLIREGFAWPVRGRLARLWSKIPW